MVPGVGAASWDWGRRKKSPRMSAVGRRVEVEKLQVLTLRTPGTTVVLGVFRNPSDSWSCGKRVHACWGAPLLHRSWFALLDFVGWALFGTGLQTHRQELEYLTHKLVTKLLML